MVWYILENIDDILLFLGLYNEESSYLVMEIMEELGIEKNDFCVWFG